MARSPVTENVERFHLMTPEEQKVFLDLVDPQPEPEPQVKQARKKRATKSAKAQSLESVIAKVPKAERSSDRCTYQYAADSTVNAGMVCDEFYENGIHDETMGYAGYHPFEAPAQPAEKKSRRRGAAASSTPSTETNSENVLTAGAGGD